MIAPPEQLVRSDSGTTDDAAQAPGLIIAARPRERLTSAWRSARGPLAVLAFVVLGVIVIVLLAPAAKSNTYLDPAGSDASGTKALVDILRERGFQVTSVYSPADALDAIGASPRNARPAVTLVITVPDLLTAAQRAQLGRAHADLFLVEPGGLSLMAFAPAISVADRDAPFGEPVKPGCRIAGARLAGSANAGQITYHRPRYAIGCYRVDGWPSVVRYSRAGRTITVLGGGSLLSNGLLAEEGNAALALNLLNAHRAIVWLTPEPMIAQPPPAAGGKHSPSLIPGTAWLVVLQLCVAVGLAAVWRARRFGPLISEQLPVIVRASETVEGHARLYQSRRARDRVASALREDMLGRMRPALGLVAGAPADAVADGIASRSRRSRQEILAIVYGPAPASDADLVRLADDLDELEREVRSQ
ncbi:MAG TPA: DUF4350 domain-containing protein [Streptosporangiaceae bacterium]|nr:DUF4350 domain-containing protein [Streptosporangiaceae bacterium]